MSRSATLAAVDRCLSVSESSTDIELTQQAIRDPEVDWLAAMALANDHLVAPALWTTLSRPAFCEIIPRDVREYLALLHARNADRNARIRRQCLAAGSTLARAGLRAALLKGAAWLFDDSTETASDRMMRDIDLAVAPDDYEATVRALEAVGYREASGIFTETGHFHHAPLECPGGEATVEIHRDLTHQARFLTSGAVIAAASEAIPGLLLPAARHRIAHNVIHAQIENGDFAAGVFNLRDGLDLARLVSCCGAEFDWAGLAHEARDRGYFRQLSGAIHSAHRILGSPLPPPFAADRLGQLQAWRCVQQRRWPRIAKPFEMLGPLTRALAWDRDAYPLGLPTRRSLRAQILVNKRRARRTVAALRRNFQERWRSFGVRPGVVSAETNIGVVERQLRQIDQKVADFHDDLASTPDDAAACFKLGVSLRGLGRNDEALNWFRKASDLRPDHAETAKQLGDVLTALKRNEEATAAYRRALSVDPDNIPALLGLGGRLHDDRQFEEADQTFAKVVELDPAHCHAWLNLGAARLGLRHHEDALTAYRQVLALEPGSVVAHCNMALALMGLDRLQEAIETSRKALFIEAGSAVATFNLSTTLLALGNFREGWEAYDYRFMMGGKTWLRPEAHAAPWSGEPLAGKSILVIGEQGNGDHIQFARYLSALCDLGASVSFLAPARLHRLFGTLPGAIALLTEIPPDARFDFQCPLMSLPGRFDRLGLPIPTRTYLAAEPERIARWKSRIGDHGFRVGVVWRGNQYPTGDGLRDFRIEALRELAAVPGVRLISLQLEDTSRQLENLPAGMSVEVLDPDFDVGDHGFLDSAAVFEVMDLVISSDTAMAHLAGALGRPLWIALNHTPEWRWQRRRSDSIWYPTARLFRQESHGDWAGVFARMTAALELLLQERAVVANGDLRHRQDELTAVDDGRSPAGAPR